MRNLKKYFSENKKPLTAGFSITLFIFLIMIIDPDVFQWIELKLLDFRFSTRGQIENSRKVVIVNIDDKSISNIGAWPWPRDTYAKLITTLKDAGAKTITFDIYFQRSATGILDEADKEFVRVVKNAGNVVLPIFFDFNKQTHNTIGYDHQGHGVFGNITTENKDFIDDYPLVKGYELFSSFSELNQAASGLGHINMIADNDGTLRKELMVVQYGDIFLPSLSLKTTQVYFGQENITMIGGEGISVGDRIIPISPVEINGAMLWGLTNINYRGGYKTFEYISFIDVINERFPLNAFKDKIVLVGATAASLFDMRSTPFAPVFPGVEKHANVIDNILLKDFIEKPFQSDVLSAILSLIIGICLTVLIPKMKLKNTMILISALTIFFFVGGYVAFTKANLWINLIYPTLVIWLVFISSILTLFSSAKTREHESSEESYDAIKMLGLSYQEKGSLDLAYNTFDKLPLTEEVMKLMYHLAMQLEKIRKDSLARHIYKKLYTKDNNYEDVAQRLHGQIVESSGADNNQDMKTEIQPVETCSSLKPGQTLGRYEIVKQLGKGAMGEVYLAKDENVGRNVAIKTFRFGDKFDEISIREIKKNLYQEAQMAGKLSHPNIVTIYDAGEDWDFSYVAMEVLEGVELKEYCKTGKLLAYDSIIEIVSTIALALDYAHDNGVIHRDIKPANIMIQKGRGIKITDFGIACINKQSQGDIEVAGTPSYMSPEQFSSRRLDGRSDLYSLGVVFFEMVCGKKPYKSNSIRELVAKIRNEAVPDLKKFNSEIPVYFQPIINKILEKDRDKRYQSGKELVGDLKSISASSE